MSDAAHVAGFAPGHSMMSISAPSTRRWASFGHCEAEECGGLNEWLEAAPRAEPVSGRRAGVLAHDEVLKTGAYRVRFRRTAHERHKGEARLLFEDVKRTFLCSDVFAHDGDAEPVTESDRVGRARRALIGATGALREHPSLHVLDRTDPAQVGQLATETTGAHARIRVPR